MIGVAVMWFLILPAQHRLNNDGLNKAVAEYSDQVESKTAALESLQAEMTTLQEKTQAAEETAKDAENKLKSQEHCWQHIKPMQMEMQLERWSSSSQ